MKFVVERSFEKSSKNLPKNIQLSILKFIEDLEAADTITELRNTKNLPQIKPILEITIAINLATTV